TPQLVYDLALLWMRHAPLDVRIAAEKARVEEDLARAAANEEERVREDRGREEPVHRERGALPRKSTRPGAGDDPRGLARSALSACRRRGQNSEIPYG